MTVLENLEQEAADKGLEVIEYSFQSDRIKGLCVDRTIAINRHLRSHKEKSCILAEELGHHYTSTGNIIDLHDTANRKQEYRARLWAYDRQIGLSGLIAAYNAGCSSQHEIASYLNITEEFLLEAIDCYRSKYGTGTMVDQYWITFIPSLQVYEYRKI